MELSKEDCCYRIKTLLLETLMDVIDQACGDGEYVRHDFQLVYENTFSILEDFGVLKDCGTGRYQLLWDKLNEN